MIRKIFIYVLFFAGLACGIYVFVSDEQIKSREAIRVESEKQINACIDAAKQSFVMLFSDRYLIGGGVLVASNERGKRRDLIITARHVFMLAKQYGLNERNFHIAIFSQEGCWKLIDIRAEGALWFDGGKSLDLAALDITSIRSSIQQAGCNPKYLASFVHPTKSSVYAICPNVYNDLAKERMSGKLINSTVTLRGKVLDVNVKREIGSINHSVIEADFDNFMKDGYSGSPVFSLIKSANGSSYELQYVGNLILALNGGINAGIAPVNALYKLMNK